MKKVTIVDIAQKAGVSTTSVSFAFNDPGRLPEGTVQKILEIAEEIGYVPDPIARSMSTGRTGVLGILVPQPISEIVRNPFLPEFVEGISEVCIREGLSIMIVPPLEGSVKRAVARTAVDGFITLGLELYKGTISILRQRGVHFVMVDSEPVNEVSAVNIDDEQGAYDIMDHVLGFGHRRIGILGIRSGKNGRFEEYTGTLRNRMNGYLKALNKYGMSIDNENVRIVECSSTMHGGREGFLEFNKTDPKPTCYVAMSDIVAFGVLEAAKDMNLFAPQDFSIVGFDDIPYAKIVNPPLTTISQPIKQKGKIAAELLVKQFNQEVKHIHRKLKTEIVIRESVGYPPKK